MTTRESGSVDLGTLMDWIGLTSAPSQTGRTWPGSGTDATSRRFRGPPLDLVDDRGDTYRGSLCATRGLPAARCPPVEGRRARRLARSTGRCRERLSAPR